MDNFEVEKPNNDSEAVELACTKCQTQQSQAADMEVGNDFKEKFLRAVADFENFKQRTERERLSWSLNAQITVLQAILPLVDDLQRASLNVPAENVADNVIAWQNGVLGVVKNITAVWQRLGVQEIPGTGEFNPELHEALCQIPNAQVASGQIIEVFRKGYTLGGVIIRHAQVSVAQ